MFGTYRNPSDANQQWGFNPTGQIYSLSKPSLVLTYVGDHDVEDITVDEESPETIPPEKQESLGLENLHFMDELELDGQITITEGVGQQPSPSLSDQTEESTDSGLAKLKDEFLGQNYSLVLLPKKHGEGAQRFVLNDREGFSFKSRLRAQALSWNNGKQKLVMNEHVICYVNPD